MGRKKMIGQTFFLPHSMLASQTTLLPAEPAANSVRLPFSARANAICVSSKLCQSEVEKSL